ncbi:arylsulfatase I [Elysia marginata]|uniref:Arylsulfatase I n=1 Tax=Elysia marginata TaxID=1093978 RepID=A0AAV4F959_9GAST|nr:arylsulfatase I [Elysia marginata]
MYADISGWNDVGWHNPQMLTPNIDLLAHKGVKLESSYVQPTCTPSRNSFLTGMFPFHTELQRAMDASTPTFLPTKYPTIAEKLKQQGYATHMVGKWHLGFCNEKYTPMRRGFDSFLGFYMGSQDYYTHVRAGTLEESVSGSTQFSSFGHNLMNSFFRMHTRGLMHGIDFRFNTTIWRNTEGIYSTHAFADRAIKVIERHDPDVPLFLYLPFSAPHSPLQVPRKYEQLYSHIISDQRKTYSGMLLNILQHIKVKRTEPGDTRVDNNNT